MILYTNGCPKCKILKKIIDHKNLLVTENHDMNILMSQGIFTVPVLDPEDGTDLLQYQAALIYLQGRDL